MRLLIDENVSPMIGQALQAAGHDVIAATDACPGAPDEDVVALATAEGVSWLAKTRISAILPFNRGCAHLGSFWSACLAVCPRKRPCDW